MERRPVTTVIVEEAKALDFIHDTRSLVESNTDAPMTAEPIGIVAGVSEQTVAHVPINAAHEVPNGTARRPEITRGAVQRALGGDRATLRTLVDVATPVIQTRAARAVLRRRSCAGARDVRQEVEDLTQAVFVELFANAANALCQWDPARGLSFTSFIDSFAERAIASKPLSRRRDRRTEWPTDDEPIAAPRSE